MDCRRGRVRVTIAILKKVILSHTTVTIAIRWLSYHIRSIPISSLCTPFDSREGRSTRIGRLIVDAFRYTELLLVCHAHSDTQTEDGTSWIEPPYHISYERINEYPDSFSSFTLGYDQGVASLRLMSSLVLHLKLLSNVYPTFIYNCVQSKPLKNSPRWHASIWAIVDFLLFSQSCTSNISAHEMRNAQAKEPESNSHETSKQVRTRLQHSWLFGDKAVLNDLLSKKSVSNRITLASNKCKVQCVHILSSGWCSRTFSFTSEPPS